jgi:hypothetical protein
MKVTFDQSIQAMWGRLGNLVFRRSYGGRVVASVSPDMSRVKWSEAQKEHRLRFKRAVAHAKAAMADPQVRARYEGEAAAKGKRPFDLAVSDHFHGRDLLQERSFDLNRRGAQSTEQDLPSELAQSPAK